MGTSGNWRCFKEIEINHSLISKEWAYDGKAYSKLYICPYGMVKTLTKLYSHRKNYHAFNVLPDLVKTNLSIKVACVVDINLFFYGLILL